MIRHPKIVVGLLAGGIFLLGFGFFLMGQYAPVTARALLAAETSKLSIQEPLTVRFNIPVNRRELRIEIVPEVEGTWTWTDDVAGHLARTAVFTPETVWAPDQDYSIKLNAVGPFLAENPSRQIELRVATLSLPTIVSASISDGATDVPTNSTIGIHIDQPITDEVDFSFRLEPEAEVLVEEDPANQQYIITPRQPLVIGQRYRLIAERELVFRPQSTGTVIRRSTPETIFERLFTVKTPPKIAAFSPSGDTVDPTLRQVSIHFSAPMNRESIERNISISPNLAGQWSWLSDEALAYNITENFQLDTRYVIRISEGGADQAGDSFPATEIGFQTAGTLRVIGASPNQQSGVSRSAAVRFVFDQIPDERSVVERISVSPVASLKFAKNGKALTATPVDGWAYNTSYTITLKPGAIGSLGRPSTRETVLRFTTEEKVVLLNIAWDRQDRALSCEAAALKMALAGKGVKVSEDEIMSRIGYDQTPRTSGGWGDPDVAFVGDINGAQNSTGYGVHWGPIAAAAGAWRPARAVRGLSLSDAARELEAGNPIVIWGVMGPSYYDPWVTPGGRTIEAWKGEHARTLIGFRGSVENPTSFIINDPIAGRVSWSAAKFRSNWATFSNSAVIVY